MINDTMNLPRSDQFPVIMMVIIAAAAFFVFWSVMDMILVGASLAVVLMPLYRRLCGHIRPVFAAALVTVAVAAFSIILAAITILILSSNAGMLSEMFSTIGTWLSNPSTNPTAYGVPLNKASLLGFLTEGHALIINYKETLLANLPLVTFKVFVFFFSLSVLLFHGDTIKRNIMLHLPPGISRYVTRLSDVTVDTLYAIYIVQVAIAVLTFFIAIPVFYHLGYGNILFFSVLAAFCELIPVMGSSVAFIIIGAYSLALGDMRGVFILFIFGYLVVSCVPEIYIRPVLVGRRVKIHPLIMFIGIIGGLLTLGLSGFVLGPVIIVLLITSFRMYIRERKGGPQAGPPEEPVQPGQQ